MELCFHFPYILLWHGYLLQKFSVHWYMKVKVKVKCTLVQALRLCTGRTAYRESRGIALPFHDNGTRGGEWSASCPSCSLPLGKTRYPLYRRLGGPQGRSGQEQKILPPIGIRSPDRPARSQSLYQLSYPAHCYVKDNSLFYCHTKQLNAKCACVMEYL